MRHVKRPKKAPSGLRGSNVKDEIAAARLHFRGRNRAKSFKFQVYKSPDIKHALLALFDGKCAYCEEILSGQPGDVEHFRPKSEITAGTETLRLPSCRDCNGERTQEMVDVYRRAKGGKANHFPVMARSRLKYPSRKGERSVLLDPCRDDPSQHLAFPVSRQGVVIPRKRGKQADRAAETIRILGLNRKLLVQARRKTLSLLTLKFDSLRSEHAAMRANPRRSATRARFAALRTRLREIVVPDLQFSECVRQAIEDTLASLRSR